MVQILLTLSLLFSTVVHAETNSESLFKGKGNLICTGGGSGKPLFSAECKQASISRVSITGGAIKYEITCTDNGNTTFLMACDAFSLEQKQVVF